MPTDPKTPRQKFAAWMKALRMYAVRQHGFTVRVAGTLDREAFRPFFEQGMKPSEAFEEDYRD
jgi:hypothetical protein